MRCATRSLAETSGGAGGRGLLVDDKADGGLGELTALLVRGRAASTLGDWRGEEEADEFDAERMLSAFGRGRPRCMTGVEESIVCKSGEDASDPVSGRGVPAAVVAFVVMLSCFGLLLFSAGGEGRGCGVGDAAVGSSFGSTGLDANGLACGMFPSTRVGGGGFLLI